MRVAKVLQIVEGTNQVQRLVIARSLSGRRAATSGPRLSHST
jgi:alkylation response protein AidB-like acyl-CoA dehydrogenase